MITLSNGSIVGFKNCAKSKLDPNNFTTKINSIIQRAEDYLILGTYNFCINPNTYPNLLESIKKNSVPKGIILPNIINIIGGPVITINAIDTVIKSLIDANVAVVIDLNNHSKFCVSEKDIYFGSANLSFSSLFGKSEVVFYHEDIVSGTPISAIQDDIVLNFQSKLNKFNTNPSITGYSDLTNRNIELLNDMTNKILKLNPAPYKVETTVNNYDECIYIINEIITSYFSILSIKEFSKLYSTLSSLKEVLNKIVLFGYTKILQPIYKINNYNLYDKSNIKEKNIQNYNLLHQKFINSLDNSRMYISNISKASFNTNLDEYAIKNRSLIKNLDKSLYTKYNI